MRNHKVTAILLVLLAATVAYSGATLRDQGQNPVNGNQRNSNAERQQRDEFESQFPIADYSAPEPSDPEKRVKREAKSKRYDNSTMSVDPSYESTANTGHWASALSALPVDQSNAVIVGEVVDAQAYLSDDKTGVYSEFTINVSEVLKDGDPACLGAGNLITVERAGGRVRFPSGKVSKYFTVGQGMPRRGRRYLLFLTRTQQDYQLLTGYELRAGRVFLLDNPGPRHPITTYQDLDEAKLLNDVRVAIASSARKSTATTDTPT